MNFQEAIEFKNTEEFKRMEQEVIQCMNCVQEIFKKINELAPLDEDYFWQCLSDNTIFPKYCAKYDEET